MKMIKNLITLLVLISFVSCDTGIIPVELNVIEQPSLIENFELPSNTCLTLRKVIDNPLGYNLVEAETKLCFESTTNSNIWKISFAEWCDTKHHWGNLRFTYSLNGDCGLQIADIQITEESEYFYNFRMVEPGGVTEFIVVKN
jgi:hypothetical protein